MAMPAVIARRLPQGAYAQRIAKGLSNAYDHRADTDTTELAQLRAVVFSDDHRGRGRGNGADDFRRCEQACCAALGWYLEQGYELWLLGDVEELWENRPKHVMERYREVLEFEQAFGTRLWRFFGNHDMAWRGKKNVQRFLAGHMADARVAESLKLTITDSGQPLGMLYLVHGHQGTLDSGNLLIVPFSRFVVRFVWGRLQRALGFASTSPATGAVLRGKHDRAMAAWADAHPERIVVIAGHTHTPVFPEEFPPNFSKLATQREQEYRDATGPHGPARVPSSSSPGSVPSMPRSTRRPTWIASATSIPAAVRFGDGDVTGLSSRTARCGSCAGWRTPAAPHRKSSPRPLTFVTCSQGLRARSQAPPRAP